MNPVKQISTIKPAALGTIVEELSLLDENCRVVVISFDENIAIEENVRELKSLCEVVRSSEIPVILAVDANEVACPLELVSAAHICIASDSSSFTNGNGKLTSRAALVGGLINRTVYGGLALEFALDTAEIISKAAPLAVKACIKAVRSGMESDLERGLEIETALFCGLFATSDMKEGTAAFFEKRIPNFQGK